MARFLDTRSAVSEISTLMKNAERTLVLITPYLKLSPDFKELLSYRDSRRKSTTIIYGKRELDSGESRFLEGLRDVVLKYRHNLHAKCYLNDDFIILTSLNLYESSMAHNKEMGVLIDRHDQNDFSLAEDAMKEVKMISDLSEQVHPKVATSKKRFGEDGLFGAIMTATRESRRAKRAGYCIRTGVQIPFDMKKPYSLEAYRSWNMYKNRNYVERFCHYSGEPGQGEVSMGRPVLHKHWHAARSTFGL